MGRITVTGLPRDGHAWLFVNFLRMGMSAARPARAAIDQRTFFRDRSHRDG